MIVIEDNNSVPTFENLEAIDGGEKCNSMYSRELSRYASRRSKISRNLELANQDNLARLNARKWLQKYILTPTLDKALTQKDLWIKIFMSATSLKDEHHATYKTILPSKAPKIIS